MAIKKGMTTIFFSPLSFVAVFGSGIRDPGSGMGKNQDPGSGMNIPDPPHCVGSLCFWASRILPSSSKNSKKTLDFFCFVDFFITFYQCSGSASVSLYFEHPGEYPLVSRTDSRIWIRIRIRTKMSRIPNTAWKYFVYWRSGLKVCNACAGCWTPTSWRQWVLTSSWLTSTMPSLKISRQEICLVLMSFCLASQVFIQFCKRYLSVQVGLPLTETSLLTEFWNLVITLPQGHDISFFACWFFMSRIRIDVHWLGSLESSSGPNVVDPDPVGSGTFGVRIRMHIISDRSHNTVRIRSLWMFFGLLLIAFFSQKKFRKNLKKRMQKFKSSTVRVIETALKPMWLKYWGNECKNSKKDSLVNC